MATRPETRAFVCGQCHVVLLQGAGETLIYPWDKGLQSDEILAFTQAEGLPRLGSTRRSGAPALKAQHPEFEMWNQGIHAHSGVTCADATCLTCVRAPRRSATHHVRSPLLNITGLSDVSSVAGGGTGKSRVETIQDRTFELRNLAMEALST